jgi:hypothetical protein
LGVEKKAFKIKQVQAIGIVQIKKILLFPINEVHFSEANPKNGVKIMLN